MCTYIIRRTFDNLLGKLHAGHPSLYIYIYIYTYIIQRTFDNLLGKSHAGHASLYIYIYVDIYIYVCGYIYIYIYTTIYVYIYMYTYIIRRTFDNLLGKSHAGHPSRVLALKNGAVGFGICRTKQERRVRVRGYPRIRPLQNKTGTDG